MNQYDEVLYPSLPVTVAHPDRLAVMAHLFGVEAPSVERARILELGCGDGSHLVPIAQEYPRCECVGVDLAQVPVESGNRIIAELGLPNLKLHAMSVTDIDDSFGKFDYIIAHGLYSWVPRFVQDAIFTICGRHLTDRGLAYISYNAYPGCYGRQMVRSMMRFHNRGVDDPTEMLKRGLQFVAEVAEFYPKSDAYDAYLRQELERYSEMNPGTIYHDDLAAMNQPEYIADFIAKARPHGLQFLAESDYYDNIDHGLSPEAIKALDEYSGGDRVMREQYRDIFRNRKFRQTILCREGIAVTYPVTPERLRGVWISTTFTAPENPDMTDGVAVEFKDHEREMGLGHGFIKAAMAELSDVLPESILFEDLLERAHRRAPQSQGSASVLAEFLLTVRAMGIVEFWPHRPRVVRDAGDRPEVTPYARLQARTGGPIATQRHRSVVIEGDLALGLIQLLDGTRDRAALGAALKERFPDATIDEQSVEAGLGELSKMSLLVR